MDTTTLFSGRADYYAVGRPDYSSEMIEYLYQNFGLNESSIIADIGSGTGKFSKQLLEKGSAVYGVEPNDDMRRCAERDLRQYRKFRSVNGNAESTALKTDSVDFITCAQAFHWFDTEKFKTESKRILRYGGKVFLVWNVPNRDDAVIAALYSVLPLFCPNFKGFGNGLQRDDCRIAGYFENRYEYAAFDNPIPYDKKSFLSRYLSSSYSLRETDSRYEQYRNALVSVFEQYEKDGMLTVGNRSVVYAGAV